MAGNFLPLEVKVDALVSKEPVRQEVCLCEHLVHRVSFDLDWFSVAERPLQIPKNPIGIYVNPGVLSGNWSPTRDSLDILKLSSKLFLYGMPNC